MYEMGNDSNDNNVDVPANMLLHTDTVKQFFVIGTRGIKRLY